MAEVKLEDAPKSVRTFYDKGMAAMERANLNYAMDMFEAALEIEPRILHIRKLLRAVAIQHHKTGNPSKLTSITTSAKGIKGLVKIATLKKKEPKAALALAEKLLRTDPLNLKFVLTLCETAIAADLPEAAVQTLEMLRDHNPAELSILEPLADLYNTTGQFKKEYDCRNKIVRLKPNDGKALKALKDAAARNTMDKAGWNKAESYRDVIKDNEQATQIEQETKEINAETGLHELIKSNLAKIEAEPENLNYRRTLADLYLHDQQFDQAIATLETCAKRVGGTDPQIDRAITEARIRKYTAEIAAARESGNPERADALALGLRQFRLNDTADRVKRYPNDLQFKYDYGMQLFAHKLYTEAIQQFQQAQRNPQRRIHSLYYLALCFKEKGQLDIAATQLEKALAELPVMDKTKKDILYELGTISEAIGDHPQSIQYFKEVYSVDIGYRDVAAKIEQAYQ